MSYIVAVDTGGTFTDCVVVDELGGFTRAKSNSTPHDFSIGVTDALGKAAAQIGLTAQELLGSAVIFSHGTTVAMNAFVAGKFSMAGLLTLRSRYRAILSFTTFN